MYSVVPYKSLMISVCFGGKLLAWRVYAFSIQRGVGGGGKEGGEGGGGRICSVYSSLHTILFSCVGAFLVNGAVATCASSHPAV